MELRPILSSLTRPKLPSRFDIMRLTLVVNWLRISQSLMRSFNQWFQLSKKEKSDLILGLCHLERSKTMIFLLKILQISKKLFIELQMKLWKILSGPIQIYINNLTICKRSLKSKILENLYYRCIFNAIQKKKEKPK